MRRRLWARTRRLLPPLFVVVLGTALAPGLYRTWSRLTETPASIHHHAGPTLEQLLPLSNLVTLGVQVSDVLETRVHGVVGGITAVVLVHGEVELSTDLSRARFEAVDEKGRTAVLYLPRPAAGQARLDHERTRVFAIARDGLWLLVPGDDADKSVVNNAYDEAQKAVASAAEGEGLRDKARTQAEQVLGKFFEAMNWQVRVRWDDRP